MSVRSLGKLFCSNVMCYYITGIIMIIMVKFSKYYFLHSTIIYIRRHRLNNIYYSIGNSIEVSIIELIEYLWSTLVLVPDVGKPIFIETYILN